MHPSRPVLTHGAPKSPQPCPRRRPIVGEWAWQTLQGAALVIEVNLGQTSDTVAVPSVGFLRPGTRNRLTYRLSSAYTVIVPKPTSVPCAHLPPALCKGPGAAPCWNPNSLGPQVLTCPHMRLLHTLAIGDKVSRKGQLLRATQLPPTSYSPSNVRADLGVSSNCSMGKGLGAAGGMVSREDHSGHNDGQGQPQPQKHHTDCGPTALCHGSTAPGRGEASR